MRRLKTAIKLLFSLGLLALVFSQIDPKELVTTLAKCNPFWLFLAFIAFNASKIVSAIRLNYYFKDLGLHLDEKTNLKLYYLGMFYNLFLPGGIGGDGYKIYLLKKHRGIGVKDLALAHILDRLSGLAALLFLGAALFSFSLYAQKFFWLKIAAIIALLFTYPIFLWLHQKLFKKFTTYLKETTLLGLAVQLLQLASAYAIVRALPQSVPLVEFLTLFLISSLVAVLPLTIGGVGAREATFLYGLKFIGYDPALGVAFSFCFFLITALSSAIGIFFMGVTSAIAADSKSHSPSRTPNS
jgi:uncharacterized membrane protein YbhN (UPF0104 family)